MQKNFNVDSKENFGKCVSCGETLHGKHCHRCGEKKISLDDFTVKKFTEQAFEIVTHFDSKILKSVYHLFSKPGFLVTEHLKGRRVSYAKPFQLFFVINVVYFLVLNYIGFDEVTNQINDHMNNPFYGKLATTMVNEELAKKNISYEKYDEEFYNEIYVESKLLIVLMIPLFALWYKLILFKENRLYYEHLIFSTYFFCFILFFYTFFLNIFQDVFDTNVAEIIVIIVSSLYLYFSIRHVYKYSFVKTLGFTFLSVIGLIITVTIFRFFIFLTVYYTI